MFKLYSVGSKINKSKLQRRIRIYLRSHSYLYNLLDNFFYTLKKKNKKI